MERGIDSFLPPAKKAQEGGLRVLIREAALGSTLLHTTVYAYVTCKTGNYRFLIRRIAFVPTVFTSVPIHPIMFACNHTVRAEHLVCRGQNGTFRPVACTQCPPQRCGTHVLRPPLLLAQSPLGSALHSPLHTERPFSLRPCAAGRSDRVSRRAAPSCPASSRSRNTTHSQRAHPSTCGVACLLLSRWYPLSCCSRSSRMYGGRL
jgi:hypothetical protein